MRHTSLLQDFKLLMFSLELRNTSDVKGQNHFAVQLCINSVKFLSSSNGPWVLRHLLSSYKFAALNCV